MTDRTAVRPFPDAALGNTSYLVEVGDGAAISIDPPRDADRHLRTARELGLRIVAVLETHLHADFVSGAREIAAATGAAVHAAAAADIVFPHVPLQPGTQIRFGELVVEVLATPGHTPEHISFLIDLGPQAVLFSGGSLIVGGAARTDLTGDERTDELTRAQYATVRQLASLPDDTVVHPTHGAGSFCSTGAARATSSTIGDERRTNPLLAVADEDEFVARMRAGFGSYPRYFRALREVNREGVPLLSSLSPVRSLPARAAAARIDDGSWLIDGRDIETFARAHPAGAVSIAVRPEFASWLGWVVPFDAPFVLMVEPEQLDDAVRLARRIGYDRIEGWTTFAAWVDENLPASSFEMIDPAEAAARDATVLDVRQRSEWDAGRIQGAVHLELGDIIAGSAAPSEVITYCGHGERSATAASLLERRGVRVANMRGGFAAWRKASLPVAGGA